jgi:hypothetical protein
MQLNIVDREHGNDSLSQRSIAYGAVRPPARKVHVHAKPLPTVRVWLSVCWQLSEWEAKLVVTRKSVLWPLYVPGLIHVGV